MGAAIGSRECLEVYVSEKVYAWLSEATRLAVFPQAKPQACYTASPTVTYFLRILPDGKDLLKPLENAISQVLIPVITENWCSQLDRDVLAV